MAPADKAEMGVALVPGAELTNERWIAALFGLIKIKKVTKRGIFPDSFDIEISMRPTNKCKNVSLVHSIIFQRN